MSTRSLTSMPVREERGRPGPWSAALAPRGRTGGRTRTARAADRAPAGGLRAPRAQPHQRGPALPAHGAGCGLHRWRGLRTARIRDDLAAVEPLLHPSLDHLTFAEANIVVAQAAFTTVAVTVAAIVDRSLRLNRRAARATAEAETLTSLAGDILRGDRAVSGLLERTRETFGMESIRLRPREGGAGLGCRERSGAGTRNQDRNRRR